MKPTRLGRGLGALISNAATMNGTAGITEVEIERISPNPRQPRQEFAEAAMEELTDSVARHGVIQPLIVTRAIPERGEVPLTDYQLVAGERRWQAAQRAGLKQVPVVIKDVSPQQMLELALVENIQREDLNPLEEALAFKALLEDLGLTQELLAKRVGKSRESVANTLRLLQLPHQAKEKLLSGSISEGHARALLIAKRSVDQLHVLEMVLTQRLSVRQTEEVARRMNTDECARPAQGGPPPSAATDALEREFREMLSAQVKLQRTKKGGKLTIYFKDDEDLQLIYTRIQGK